ncbi:unnamed protein product, partial [Prorocentrum cordatum]
RAAPPPGKLLSPPGRAVLAATASAALAQLSTGDGRIEGNDNGKSRTEDGVAILADPTSSEAVATALVLVQLLRQQARVKGTGCEPCLVQTGDQSSAEAKSVLVVCTTGVFVQPHVINNLLAHDAGKKRMIPIIADESFGVPTAQWSKDQRPLIESFCSQTDQAMDIVTSLFKQTPFLFDAAAYSEALLETKAMDLAAMLVAARADGAEKDAEQGAAEIQVVAPADPTPNE